jgi:hypothetical protein
MEMTIKTNKPTKIALLFLINFMFLVSLTNAQKVYELNEINRIPYIQNSDMRTIALSLFDLYKEVVKSPEKYSTIESTKDTVNNYVYINSEEPLRKYETIKGLKYSLINQSDIEKNDMLFFNLNFDEHGNIDIADNLNFISCRTDNRGNIIKAGAIAFNLPLADSILNELKGIKLETVAAIDINSLNNELKPVKVKIPLQVSLMERPSEYTSGKVEKRGERVEYDFRCLSEERKQIINIIETQTELSKYKKGLFDFKIKHRYFDYYIKFCLDTQMFYSSQPTDFRTTSLELESFSGEGKKY